MWINGLHPRGRSSSCCCLQVGLDSLDQNKSVNKPGQIQGSFKPTIDKVSTDRLQPYSEVFGLQRFRETELIHGRWAMLATLGAIVGEATTGVSWVDAGKVRDVLAWSLISQAVVLLCLLPPACHAKQPPMPHALRFQVELDGAQYLGFSLPFSITQLVWIEAILVGSAEWYRNTELDPEKRIYPGGAFDPLGFAGGDRAFQLKTAEIKHGRLAMIAFLGEFPFFLAETLHGFA